MTAGPVTLELALDPGRPRQRLAFEPGARVSGIASWSAAHPVRAAELRLAWITHGKGGRDIKIAATMPLPDPRPSERRPFILTLPGAPWTFIGVLISLSWVLELVVSPGDETARIEIVVAPGGSPIDLRLPTSRSP
jgi:hypothetical protein